MARADLAFGQEPLNTRRELEETERIGHRRSTLAHSSGHLFVGVPELFDELLVSGSFFEDVEILAMQILHQRLLETSRFVGRLNQDRNGLEARPPGRPPPSLASDQFELVSSISPDLPYQNGLKNT
jgi:hypothetical protein